jgi:hypothetical protein
MASEMIRFGRDTTRQQAHEFQAVLFDDLTRIGLDGEAAAHMAYDGGNANPGNLMRRMEQGPKEYYGLRQEGSLAAVAALGDWLYGDEAPFVHPLTTKVRRVRHHLNVRWGTEPAYDTGLVAFGVKQGERYQAVAQPFLQKLADVAATRGSKMVKAAIDSEDESLQSAFEALGGKPLTRNIGSIAIHDVERDYQLWGLDVS